MKKKIITIFVSMLLCVTVFSVTGAVNVEKTVYIEPKTASTDIFWEDNFDSYPVGPLHGLGGWEAWDNVPAVTAYVTDNQSRSPSNSVEIAWFSGVSADIVQQFIGVSSGKWNLTTWGYIPSDLVGNSFFILLNKYEHGVPHVIQDWSCQIGVNTTRIWDFDNVDDWLPTITDDWVELRVEIDFEADIQTVYYNDVVLFEKSWTAGVSPGGQKNLACIDLYADNVFSSSIYWDDFVLEGEVGDTPVLLCEGDLHFGNVSAGATVTDSFTVENVGGGLLDWEITDEPSWGTWTFDPESGDDLPPGAPVTVQVTVVAPKEKADYVSTITVTNMENPDNTCTIDVSMTTPTNRPFNFNYPLLSWLFERFPNAFPILRYMLGL
ncbi:MAG: hypothetical protein JSW06_02005 [Thermoplasmatales archaeon]|nr:MAG: hypothetical protein JSW06_02005 [Thermoplasmatales archaeon]